MERYRSLGPYGVLQKARELAYKAHHGQTDKAGRPYIEHVIRVAAAVSDCPLAESVAWLHDVLEDAPQYATEVERFPPDIHRAVVALTRMPGEPPLMYYSNIKRSPLAYRVKLADIKDNTDPARLALLDETTRTRLKEKYRKAEYALSKRARRPLKL